MEFVGRTLPDNKRASVAAARRGVLGARRRTSSSSLIRHCGLRADVPWAR